MNLLDEPWMPVRLHSGEREWIAPHQLSDARIAAFDADRADFNGALAQFAIGLLQTCTTVDNAIEWRGFFSAPPDQTALHAWFEPHRNAFEFDGSGARFMQDFDLRATEGESVAIGSLLIETPGENTLKNNSDHFVKRGLLNQLCPCCAALALFTLQLNAPSGGAGHRTGLRGGGPLTTLLLAEQGPHSLRSLWHDLWLNVREREGFLASGGDSSKSAPHHSFPWLASVSAMQTEGGSMAPVQVHPSHVFWAMPRRIRLDFETVGSGACDMCGRESDRQVRQYVTRNYGLNYKGAWSHPLSPYYESKEGWLPLHPQPGGLGYRHWLGWVLGMQNENRKVKRAEVIAQFFEAQVERRTGVRLRLWAFGYDMDNMKARCWYEATMPLYALNDCDRQVQKDLGEEVGSWLTGAELAASYTRGAVKDAWFGGDARGDFSFVDSAFWSRTETAFYELLRERINAARQGTPVERQATAERWRERLRNTALRLFDDELVGTGPVERQNPARIAKAHHQLSMNLNGPKLRGALGLPVKASAKPTDTKGAKAA
ncbi:MAG: type I-E CRISPR-associated protein Cse1/CasA [Burkholderiales bacterium]|nr:type I-E CRISPR-associated protein Cse1/CasA [Burkholderiales bacterium]